MVFNVLRFPIATPAILLVAAMSACFTAQGAQQLLSGSLRNAAELPLDRFDEYQANTFPPYPWTRLGARAEEIEIVLKPDANTPFAKNDVTGKGLVLTDATANSGNGAGLEYAFTPPPPGKVYVGFDFRYTEPEAGAGLDFVCKLSDGVGRKGLVLHLGSNGKLSLENAANQVRILTDLKPGLWYHLAAVLENDQLSLTLVDVTNVRLDRYSARVRRGDLVFKAQDKISSPDTYTTLSFFSNGPDAGTGSWTIDNICMAGQVDASRKAWYPFDMLPTEKLRACKRKVFAYFYIYSSGYSNEDPGLSWYTRTVLNPTLTKPDRRKAGSEMPMRPLPRPPMQAPELSKREQVVKAMEEEVRIGIQTGLDGFFADFHSHPKSAGGVKYFTEKSFMLMDAAATVDPGFKIIPAVYSDSTTKGIHGKGDAGRDPLDYANSPIIKRIAEHPAAMRLKDGRLVLSMWLSERHSPGWWQKVLAQMAKNGYPAVLLAQFNTHGDVKAFSEAGICHGMAQWGPRQVCDYNWVAEARPLTDTVVFPVAFQDVRTRSCGLWEASNSGLLRSLWGQAIEDKADWVFLNTWSDYTETPMAPSTFIGFVPCDLNAYYTQWFKTGKQPEITRDRLYYIYRRNHSSAESSKCKKWSFSSGNKAKDEIELLAFLTAPGELRIEAAGKVYSKQAAAGIISFKVPLPKDTQFVPEFTLSRNGNVLAKAKGRYTVLDKVEYPHMIYSAGVIAPNE
jgi:hypothetical protein